MERWREFRIYIHFFSLLIIKTLRLSRTSPFFRSFDPTVPTSHYQSTTNTRTSKMGTAESDYLYYIKKRRTQSYNVLKRMTEVDPFSKVPTEILSLINVGFGGVGGVTVENLLKVVEGLEGYVRLAMTLATPFSFIIFETPAHAEAAYALLDTKPSPLLDDKIIFTEYIDEAILPPSFLFQEPVKVPGLFYFDKFLTEQEEAEILAHTKDITGWQNVKSRNVKHFGWSYDYKKKHIGQPLEDGFPSYLPPILDRFYAMELGQTLVKTNKQLNQLTVSTYPVGSGIPPHCDSHTAFHDTVLIFSMENSILMEFRDLHRNTTSLELKPRSLVVLTGDARYKWEHAIRLRKSDLLPTGLLQPRQFRSSLTLRRIQENPSCDCDCPELCDYGRPLRV